MTGVMANVRTHPTTNHKRMYADIDHCECLIIWGTEPMTANKGPSWLAPRLSVARERGMSIASHDDDSEDKLAFMDGLEATISEFPISLDIARAARTPSWRSP